MVEAPSDRNPIAPTGRAAARLFFMVTAGGLLLLLCFVVARGLATRPANELRPVMAGGSETDTAMSSSPMDGPQRELRAHDTRPNIIVVYVDDMRASDLAVMTNVKNRIAGNGVSFTNSIVSTSACCPARATHLSGKYSHNTGVLHNSPPHGGYGVFRSGVQADGQTLPIWLQDAGYRTVHFGKLMNHYPDPTAKGEVPRGFTDWYGLYEGEFEGKPYSIYRQTRYVVRVRPMAGQPSLLDPGLARHVRDAPEGGEGHLYEFYGHDVHQTEVLMDGAVRAVEQQHDGSAPMYLNVWLTAPHTGGDGPMVGGKRYDEKFRPFTTRPAQPELRELNRRLRRGKGLGDLRYDKPPSFNESNVADKPRFVRQTPRLGRKQIRDIEIRNALRLASLKSVDRKISELLDAVEEVDRRTGRESYVVFSSDGGYFLGEHRLPYEKNWHYGAATDVPLIIRGPGVQQGTRVPVLVGNIDLAPTFLDMASQRMNAIDPTVDGRSLLPLLQRSGTAARSLSWERRTLLLEGFYGKTARRRYSGVRNQRYVYVEHYAKASGEITFRELYDLRRDRGYRHNALHRKPSREARAVARRMAVALRELKDCAGRECRRSARARPVAQATTVGHPLARDATGAKSTTRPSIAKE